MKPVMQDKFGLDGNCLSASIASILELPLAEVPSFHTGIPEGTPQDDPEACVIYWNNVHRFLNERGYGLTIFEGVIAKSLIQSLSGYFIVGGKSPRGYSHAVVYSIDGLAHDPHPEGGGVIPEHLLMVYPFFCEVYHGKA